MSFDKRLALIGKLLEHTRNGKLDWEETTNPDEFIISRNELSIAILKTKNSQNHNLYIFTITDEDGDTIDEFDDEVWEGDNDIFRMIAELHKLARGYAKGTEQALDKLLQSFEDTPF